MSSYVILSILISISAGFAYINHRIIKMPFVIGLFFLSTAVSVVVLSTKFWIATPYVELRHFVEDTDISKYILDMMLGFLLFAGSLHTDWHKIKDQIKPISLLAIGGVLLSTAVISSLFYLAGKWFHLELDFIYCLLFGALISPTDPIAVLGILTKAKVPEKIEATIVGESLFNDGIGVVLFIALLEILASGGGEIDYAHFGVLFAQEALGGIAFGLILGYFLYRLLKSIDHYETEVLLTVSFVMLGYTVANLFHVSGPLAMVVMGLFVGNFKKGLAMSDTTEEYVSKFWELVDVILNAILFILIALVLVVIDFHSRYFLFGMITVVIVLLARVIVVSVPRLIMPRILKFTRKESRLIIWGGLRGGLSIALVLSLPNSEAKNILLVATYFCVLFSILVQGLTIEKLARKI